MGNMNHWQLPTVRKLAEIMVMYGVEMSEQTQADPNAMPAPVAQKWAVIQTGYVTLDAEIIAFRDEKNNRTPVVLRIVGDEATARKMMRRMGAMLSRVKGFAKDGYDLSTPIYGVIEMAMELSKARKPMTPEQKAKMAAGKRGRGK